MRGVEAKLPRGRGVTATADPRRHHHSVKRAVEAYQAGRGRVKRELCRGPSTADGRRFNTGCRTTWTRRDGLYDGFCRGTPVNVVAREARWGPSAARMARVSGDVKRVTEPAPAAWAAFDLPCAVAVWRAATRHGGGWSSRGARPLGTKRHLLA